MVNVLDVVKWVLLAALLAALFAGVVTFLEGGRLITEGMQGLMEEVSPSHGLVTAIPTWALSIYGSPTVDLRVSIGVLTGLLTTGVLLSIAWKVGKWVL